LNLTFLTLWLTFVLLGLGAIYTNVTLTHVGGYMGIFAAFFASYTSFAIIINSIRPNTVPTGPGIHRRKK
ncbi:MAG: GPR1/FUN34/YaaH family transporter, partial [Candidatus Thermoplasmatota archaeon]|nr:GPR1/FUN34/YaaH family transporter [Candidatus Thermoplasmatota archaeon]